MNNKKYPYAKVSKKIYHALNVTVWITVILSILAITLSLLSRFIVNIASFLFEPNWAYEWYQSTNAKNDGGMEKVFFLKYFFPDTSNWSENIEKAISLDSGTMLTSILMTALTILSVLLIFYIFTIIMRHHHGEIAPFLDDREAVKLKRRAVRALGAGVRDIYDESDRKIKKLEHGARFSIRRMKVDIHTTLDKGHPKPTKKYSVVIKKPRKIAVNKIVVNKIKELHDILTDLTDGVSFDQMKTTANKRYYIFDGVEEKELKEARSVVKRREKYKNGRNKQNVADGVEGITTSFPLELLNDLSEDVLVQTQRAQEYTENIKDLVTNHLSTIKMPSNLNDVYLTSRTAVLSYNYRYNPNQPDDNKIAKAMSSELRVKNIIANSDAGRLEIEIPFPSDPKKTDFISIPIDYKKVLSDMLENVKPDGDTSTVYGVLSDGTPVVNQVSDAPHLLVVGATGSGKSVALNTILVGLLSHNTPEQVKLLIIDPKKVEFTMYEDSPYMLTNPITEVEDAEYALEYAVMEMEKRYSTLLKNKVKKISDYNKLAEKNNKLKKMEHWFIIIDEFSDFKDSLEDFKHVETLIKRLGQKARACGIHLILATQSPRAEVITGIIKANLPLKIAFQTSTRLESHIALDDTSKLMTADELLGRGDGLMKKGSDVTRFQAPFISDEEINNITTYWRENYEKPVFVDYKAVVARARGEENSAENEAYQGAVTSYQQTILETDKNNNSEKKSALEKAAERKKEKERSYKVDMSKYFKDKTLEIPKKDEDKSLKNVEPKKEEKKKKTTSDILGI